jgi:hypothetical protein
MVPAAARKQSNLASNAQSGWSNGFARGTGLISVNMSDCVMVTTHSDKKVNL